VTGVLAFLFYAALTTGIVLVTGALHRVRTAIIGSTVVVVGVAVPFGHVLNDSRLTYPFVRWNMYSTARFSPSYVAHVATDRSGFTFHYPYRYVAVSSPRAFMARLEQLIQACRCGSGDRLVDETFQALAALETRRTGRLITEIAIYRVSGRDPSADERRTLLYAWRPSKV
jgi:hypothetical protein